MTSTTLLQSQSQVMTGGYEWGIGFLLLVGLLMWATFPSFWGITDGPPPTTPEREEAARYLTRCLDNGMESKEVARQWKEWEKNGFPPLGTLIDPTEEARYRKALFDERYKGWTFEQIDHERKRIRKDLEKDIKRQEKEYERRKRR